MSPYQESQLSSPEMISKSTKVFWTQGNSTGFCIKSSAKSSIYLTANADSRCDSCKTNQEECYKRMIPKSILLYNGRKQRVLEEGDQEKMKGDVIVESKPCYGCAVGGVKCEYDEKEADGETVTVMQSQE